MTAIQKGSTSLAHTGVAPACWNASSKPPMPLKSDPIVMSLSYWAAILLASTFQNGSAIELPSALYLAESVVCLFLPCVSVYSPMSVHPSSNPWSLSHSSQRGVSLLTSIMPSPPFSSFGSLTCTPPQNYLLVVHTVQRTHIVLQVDLMQLSVSYSVYHVSPTSRCMRPVRSNSPDDCSPSVDLLCFGMTTTITPL